jgi:hypothetical protein
VLGLFGRQRQPMLDDAATTDRLEDDRRATSTGQQTHSAEHLLGIELARPAQPKPDHCAAQASPPFGGRIGFGC